MNMRTSSTRPPSCIYCLGELSHMVGTPANMLFPSERDSAKSSSKPPPRARFLQKQKWGEKAVYYSLHWSIDLKSFSLDQLRICMQEWPTLHLVMCVCITFTAETAALRTKTIYTSLCRHTQPARAVQHPQLQHSLLSICYSTNLVVLKLFCTSDLAIYTKVVQRLLWENRTAVLLKEVTHLQGCSKPRV